MKNLYSKQSSFRQGAAKMSNRSVYNNHEDCELSGNAAENSSAKSITIGFIGAGNMANSLILGLLADGYDAHHIWATNTTSEQLDNLKNLNIHTSTDNRLLVKQVDIVVLAVKPQVLKQVTAGIADLIQEKKPLVISIAAAINLKTLQAYLQDNAIPIVRCMPNTPALLGCGATGLLANPHCSTLLLNHYSAV